MKEYKLHDIFGGELVINVKNDRDCIFCKHRKSLFWDYSNGPYFMSCACERPEVDDYCSHTCELFEEMKGETE